MSEPTEKEALRIKRVERFEQAIDLVSQITGNNVHQCPLCKTKARRNELILHIYNRHSDSKSEKFLKRVSHKSKNIINEAHAKIGGTIDGLPESRAKGRKPPITGNSFKPYQGGIPGLGKKS